MLKMSYECCLGLSPAISSQFTFEMCTEARNFEKTFAKKPTFVGSKSFKVINVNKSKKPVTGACYDKQHFCTYLQLFLH